MPLLNYTTKIPARQTAGEVLGILSSAGAERVTLITDRTTREVSGVEFEIETHVGNLAFRLPVDVDRVLAYLEGQRKGGQIKAHIGVFTREQASAVGWRIIKDWIEAQVALIQTGLVKLEQVMLPYMLRGEITMFEAFERSQLALMEPEA